MAHTGARARRPHQRNGVCGLVRTLCAHVLAGLKEIFFSKNLDGLTTARDLYRTTVQNKTNAWPKKKSRTCATRAPASGVCRWLAWATVRREPLRLRRLRHRFLSARARETDEPDDEMECISEVARQRAIKGCKRPPKKKILMTLCSRWAWLLVARAKRFGVDKVCVPGGQSNFYTFFQTSRNAKENTRRHVSRCSGSRQRHIAWHVSRLTHRMVATRIHPVDAARSKHATVIARIKFEIATRPQTWKCLRR